MMSSSVCSFGCSLSGYCSIYSFSFSSCSCNSYYCICYWCICCAASIYYLYLARLAPDAVLIFILRLSALLADMKPLGAEKGLRLWLTFPRGPADILRVCDPLLDFFVDLVLAPIIEASLKCILKCVQLTLSVCSRRLRCDIMCANWMKEIWIFTETVTIPWNLLCNLCILRVFVIPNFCAVTRRGALETAQEASVVISNLSNFFYSISSIKWVVRV